VPPNQVFRQAELQPQTANFVLEQVSKRLDKLKAKLRGKAADVVMQLDGGCRAVLIFGSLTVLVLGQ